MSGFGGLSLIAYARLGLRLRQTIQQAPPRFPGGSRDPPLPWAPAFAGEAGSSVVLHCLVNRVNDCARWLWVTGSWTTGTCMTAPGYTGSKRLWKDDPSPICRDRPRPFPHIWAG